MPLSRTKRLIAVGATAVAATVGVGGLVGFANADSPKQPASSQAADQTGDQTQDPSYKSSVTAPEQNGQNEADQSAALQSLAKISPDQARDAALAAVPGTADKVELDNENGNVVYSVTITDASGAKTDVKVDAGNGSVLHKDSGDANERAGAETPNGQEAPETQPGV
jgi:uncharacterized membrane protein YkoI